MKICAPRIDLLHQLSHSELEPGVGHIVSNSVRTGDTVIEVGGHIGYYTVYLANRVGPNGHVYVFEPDPVARRFLVRNVAINELANVTVLPHAVADAISFATLSAKRFGETYSSIGDAPRRLDFRKHIVVPTTTLDAFCDEHAITADFVKIDVEGAEGKALTGASRTLTKCRFAIVELHPLKLVRDFATNPDNVVDQLLGFDGSAYITPDSTEHSVAIPLRDARLSNKTVRVVLANRK